MELSGDRHDRPDPEQGRAERVGGDGDAPGAQRAEDAVGRGSPRAGTDAG
ncbi:MAG TPA: hypothetical protein VK817_03955 [Trebonia sp.]|jgi:hypothetical protein|nr:hypothetical protein [Trebonia sp.]